MESGVDVEAGGYIESRADDEAPGFVESRVKAGNAEADILLERGEKGCMVHGSTNVKNSEEKG